MYNFGQEIMPLKRLIFFLFTAVETKSAPSAQHRRTVFKLSPGVRISQFRR